MGTFMTDGASVLPDVKSDARTPTGAVTEWAAADCNDLRTALLDVRTAVLGISAPTAGFVNVRDYGAVGDGATDDTVAFQAAISSLTSYQTLICNGNFRLTAGLLIQNKTNVRITGSGRLFFDGASSSAIMLQPAGTITNLEIDGLTLVGDGLSVGTQVAIGNLSSGPYTVTATGCSFHDLKISYINVGISLNADLGGSFTKAHVYANTLSNITGTVSGSGYGIHMANATRTVVEGNVLDNCSRHSIYNAKGTGCGNVIIGNSILNHRLSVADLSYRCALVVSRSSDVSVIGNKFVWCYDGQIEVSHVSADALNCSNVLIANNTFYKRQNVVSAIRIGEEAVPTTWLVTDVQLIGNEFVEDYAASSTSSAVYILNGARIKISGNTFRVVNGTVDTLGDMLTLGNDAYINADAHINDIVVTDNHCTADVADVTGIFAMLCTRQCTSEPNVTVKNNVRNNGYPKEFGLANPVATNPYTKFKFTKTVTQDVGTVGANGGTFGARWTVEGAKPTSIVTGRPQYSKFTSPLVYTFFADDADYNLIDLVATNATHVAQAPGSQAFVISFEDF